MTKQEWLARAAVAAATFGTGRDAFDEAAARMLGMHRTDLRILVAVNIAGPLSAGALAGEVGLSPAATTEARRARPQRSDVAVWPGRLDHATTPTLLVHRVSNSVQSSRVRQAGERATRNPIVRPPPEQCGV